MESSTNQELLVLTAHPEYSYVPRTRENAASAQVTVAFAIDFTTAGERLTRSAAGTRYVAIPLFSEVNEAAVQLAMFMKERQATTLNVAGNGIYSICEHNKASSQKLVNQWVYDVLAQVHKVVGFTQIRSGGQTGVDHAGLVAAVALGVPATGLYPKSFRQRNELGQEVHSNASTLMRKIQAESLQVKGRKFHKDGTLPANGEILVFGSNLAGRHGAGSALAARNHFGAIYGQGEGPQGQSYAVPTKDGRNGQDLKLPEATLSLPVIKRHIDRFISYATAHPELEFFVVRLGCSLATHHDSDIAPMFVDAPSNCDFPEDWKPWLSTRNEVATDPPINIFSGSPGLGGALTNMSERAREKGRIKHSYPVKINEVTYPDSEAAYQMLKIPGNDEYNDGLMIDIIALKFLQNEKLLRYTREAGGADWLAKCSHFTHAKSPNFQSWEGQGMASRFIRNLVFGYKKALTGRGPVTRIVHVEQAPYDVYIGRDMTARNPKYKPLGFGNIFPVEEVGSVEASVTAYYDYVLKNPELRKKILDLQGKTVGCWCKKRDNYDRLCHGEIVVAVAENKPWELKQPVQAALF